MSTDRTWKSLGASKSPILHLIPKACADENAAYEFMEARRWGDLIDATDGSGTGMGDPLLCFFNGLLVRQGSDGGEDTVDVGAANFGLYLNNLKGEWNSWQD